MNIYLQLLFYPSIYLHLFSIYLSIYLSKVSIHLSIYIYLFIYIYTPVYLSIYLFYLSIYLSFLSIYLSPFLNVFFSHYWYNKRTPKTRFATSNSGSPSNRNKNLSLLWKGDMMNTKRKDKSVTFSLYQNIHVYPFLEVWNSRIVGEHGIDKL